MRWGNLFGVGQSGGTKLFCIAGDLQLANKVELIGRLA